MNKNIEERKNFLDLAKQNNIKIKTYKEFCHTKESDEYALDDDIKFYEEQHKYENITDENIEDMLETIGEEIKGLSSEERTNEENAYYEELYKKSMLKETHAA